MKKLIAIIASSVVLAGNSQAQTVVYDQPFNNTTRTSNPPNGFTQSISGAGIGWSAAFGDSANSFNATAFPNSSNSANAPVTFPFTSGGGDSVEGYLFSTATLRAGQPQFYYIDTLNLGTVANFDRIEFDLRNTSVTENLQAAIRIGTSWFVTSNVYNNSTTNVWTNNISTGATAWAPLTYTIGAPFAIGASGTLPISGNITGVGLYDASHGDSVRIDNVQVFAVPEPSTYLILVAAVAALVMIQRSRGWLRF